MHVGETLLTNGFLPSVLNPFLPREKKLLVSSEDYGRDLTGVQNLRKKHKRLEAELGAHEPAIQVRPRNPALSFSSSSSELV